jgi:KDO2-lipid IV(A) lauroyltransferase
MVNRGKVRTGFEYALARLLFYAMGNLPPRIAVTVGRALAFATYLVVPRLRRIGDLNLRMACPMMSPGERKRLLRRSMLNLGRHMGAFTGLARISPEELRRSVDCEGLEHIEAARQQGHGVILPSAHLGAWELMSFAMTAFGFPFDFLVRRIENPAVERLIDAIRTRFGNRAIDKRSAARAMLNTLRSGNLLALLVDINVVRDKGIFVDFFGVPACTTFIAAKLSLRTGAPLVPIFAPWDEQRHRYVMQILAPVTIERSGDEERDVRALTEKFTKVVEDEIRRYPDQWLWIHKRWRTQPKGQPNFYAELE